MIERSRSSLLRLLDRMDDHYDGKLADNDFRDQARWCRAVLDAEPVSADVEVVVATAALDVFLGASAADQWSWEAYGELRLALAELEPPISSD